jgi:hypothetical protein
MSEMNLNGRLDGKATRLASVAALVNGFVFALMPLVMMLVTGALAQESDTSTIVRPEGAPPVSVVTLSYWIQMWRTLLPLALIAAWRTFVHARRRLTGDDHNWRGVFEAGLCGFLYALVLLARGILARPMQAPPFVIVYGGLGLTLGLIVGLVLRTTAVLTLGVSKRLAA